MPSTTTNSENGSPGPSIQYEDFSYAQEQRSTFESDSANTEIKRLRRELDNSHQRIERDTSVINNLHEKVTELEALVKKQRITISTQSKAISDRRVLRKNQQQQQQPQSPMGPATGAGMGMFPMTPSGHHQQHQVHQSQYLGSGTSGASGASGGSIGVGPCASGMVCIHNTSSPFEAHSQDQAPQSVKSFDQTTQYNTVFDQPPPKFEIPPGSSYTAYTPAVPSGLAPNLENGKDVFNPGLMGSTVANVAGPMHSAASVIAANYHKEMSNFSTRFLGLMRMAEIFGQTHASLPNIFMDSRLDEHVKDYLMAISSRTQASILIGNASTRGFFVARAINWYLIEKILKINIIRGLDPAVDMEIGEMQKQITSDTPIVLRHLMLNAISAHLKNLSKRPDFNGFAKKKIHAHVTNLWSFIGPLGHDLANQNNMMWIDLNAIISEAHSLAIQMYSVPLEYRFEFPEHSEPFDPLTMINRGPYVHGDPHVLQTGDVRVRLSITPTVRIRNNSQTPGEVHLMYLGHVLLKVPKKQ